MSGVTPQFHLEITPTFDSTPNFDLKFKTDGDRGDTRLHTYANHCHTQNAGHSRGRCKEYQTISRGNYSSETHVRGGPLNFDLKLNINLTIAFAKLATRVHQTHNFILLVGGQDIRHLLQ